MVLGVKRLAKNPEEASSAIAGMHPKVLAAMTFRMAANSEELKADVVFHERLRHWARWFESHRMFAFSVAH